MNQHRKLKKPLLAYRIGDSEGHYPIFSPEGAKFYPGRWNKPMQAVIYASKYYSTAVLEKLIRLGEMPPNQCFVTITIPAGVSYEEITTDSVPGWYEKNAMKAREFGSQWYSQNRSLILIVPSVVARLDHNIVINTEHQEFSKITVSRERRIWWDDRLFK